MIQEIADKLYTTAKILVDIENEVRMLRDSKLEILEVRIERACDDVREELYYLGYGEDQR